MVAFIVRRLLLSVIVLVLVTIIIFLLLHIMPGDPAMIMLGMDANQQRVDALRKELWLDRPLTVQYIHWVSNAVKGDLGKSVSYHESVSSLISTRLPITMYISFLALILSTIIGIAGGIICAVRRGGVYDSVITLFANAGMAVPIFWLGILGIYFFGLHLRWLPIQGYTSPFENFGLNIKQLIMPVICLIMPAVAVLIRQTRSSMLEIARQDFIRTAWSKGLKERGVVLKHALKNALIPVVTLLGVQIDRKSVV
jgi:peptide/nickel transport system permease protein